MSTIPSEYQNQLVVTLDTTQRRSGGVSLDEIVDQSFRQHLHSAAPVNDEQPASSTATDEKPPESVSPEATSAPPRDDATADQSHDENTQPQAPPPNEQRAEPTDDAQTGDETAARDKTTDETSDAATSDEAVRTEGDSQQTPNEVQQVVVPREAPVGESATPIDDRNTVTDDADAKGTVKDSDTQIARDSGATAAKPRLRHQPATPAAATSKTRVDTANVDDLSTAKKQSGEKLSLPADQPPPSTDDRPSEQDVKGGRIGQQQINKPVVAGGARPIEGSGPEQVVRATRESPRPVDVAPAPATKQPTTEIATSAAAEDADVSQVEDSKAKRRGRGTTKSQRAGQTLVSPAVRTASVEVGTPIDTPHEFITTETTSTISHDVDAESRDAPAKDAVAYIRDGDADHATRNSRTASVRVDAPEIDAARVRSETEVRQPSSETGRGQFEADRVRFLQRVTRAFELASQRGGVVRLRLSPPELGSLRVELNLQGGALSARLETETPAAQSALLDSLPALRERLAEQNVKIERFEVDLMNQSADDAARHARDERQSAASAPANHARRAATADSDSETETESQGPQILGDDKLNVIV